MANYLFPPPPLGFPSCSAGEESACDVGDLGSTPGLGRSPEEGNGYPLHYCGLEKPKDRGDWQATVYRVPESRTQLSDFHTSHFTPSIKKMLGATTTSANIISLGWGSRPSVGPLTGRLSLLQPRGALSPPPFYR